MRHLTAVAAALLGLVVAAAADAAATHKLECPAAAPADWNLPGAPLSGVEVLSAPIGETIDEKSPPSLVPDENTLRAGTLRQSWRMDGDGSGWVRFVDCRYRGSLRVLRLEASHLASCERVVTHFSETSGAGKLSKETMICD
jgi:hypothetical protein